MAQLRALITGVTGQDGSYLSELLLEKGYEVHGFARRNSRPTDERVVLHVGDLTDPASLRFAIRESDPHEIYNLGAQSHVAASFVEPEYSFRATAEPILTILEYIREKKLDCRVYQASSSEMFGTSAPPQCEDTPFLPRSPYAVAKVAAHNFVRLYREAYGIFAVGGVLFNHESQRRPTAFVTRKISRGVAKIALGLADHLTLGNLDAKRDWGHAADYVEAMWRMLQQPDPRDYVVATGETHTVREFLEEAIRCVETLTGFLVPDWNAAVRVDDKFARPAEVPALCGDASRAREDLGWQPRTRFQDLVRQMVENDVRELGRGSRIELVAS